MKQSEKMIVFALATVFHAARICGATFRGESSIPGAGASIDAAQEFVASAKAADIVPDLPDDDEK